MPRHYHFQFSRKVNIEYENLTHTAKRSDIPDQYYRELIALRKFERQTTRVK